MNSQLIDASIQDIIRWFKTDYDISGSFPVYDIDGDTGKALSNRTLLCEFDDYAPFFWVLGEEDFILSHHKKMIEMLESGSLLFNHPQIRSSKGLGLPGIFRRYPYADSQDYVEILYGLTELHSLSGRGGFLRTAEVIFDRLIVHFERHGMLRSFRILPFGPTLSIADAMSGMFIEIACDLASLSSSHKRKQQYTDYAVRWMQRWLDTQVFQAYGVFPSVFLDWPWGQIPFLQKRTRRAYLAKPNASMAYGLLALSMSPFKNQTARNAFDTWIDGLYRHFATADCVLSHVANFNNHQQTGPVLSTNFAILDILCDAVHFLDSRGCLDLAVSIATYFLAHQSKTTGLIPDEPGDDRSYIDANSDFAVSLAKLSEVTGDASYLESGRQILDGILKYHRAPFGFYRDVNLNTGKPLSSLVETRFCSLLLKPLILYKDTKPIYDNPGRWSLFRDR